MDYLAKLPEDLKTIVMEARQPGFKADVWEQFAENVGGFSQREVDAGQLAVIFFLPIVRLIWSGKITKEEGVSWLDVCTRIVETICKRLLNENQNLWEEPAKVCVNAENLLLSFREILAVSQ